MKLHWTCPECGRRLRRAGACFPKHFNNAGKQCRTSDQVIGETK